QDRAHECDGRALAIGSGDVDRRRQLPLRVAERGENAPHPIEREIDALRMQRGEPRDDGIDGGHAHSSAIAPPAPRNRRNPRARFEYIWNRGPITVSRCAREPRHARAATGKFSGGAWVLVNSRHKLATVGRRFRRWTTMSIMPCSRRYSARWKPSARFSPIVL